MSGAHERGPAHNTGVTAQGRSCHQGTPPSGPPLRGDCKILITKYNSIVLPPNSLKMYMLIQLEFVNELFNYF